METEFQSAVGKSMGEVIRDIAEFLSCSCIIHPEKQIDLARILPDLNMEEQFSFALLSEAEAQGWEPEAAEKFYRHAVQGVVSERTAEAMISAFRAPQSEAYLTYRAKYGNRFHMLDGSYWSTCLALGIDAERVGDVMQYLRLFTICLMEFAYMGDRNPTATYTWVYYESFRSMLDELTAPPEPEPLPLKVRALGGSAGRREGEVYALSLGVDIENPNPDRMARDVTIDITLKDKNEAVIATVKDQIRCIDPATVYHYGVTKRIRGAATAHISASAKASGYLKLSTPIMKHIKLSALRMTSKDGETSLSGRLNSAYDVPVSSLTLHYQFLSADNRILGGGNEWLLDGIGINGEADFQARIPVLVKNTAKAVYSVDFDAIELVKS